MILYFANRRMEILGQASTELEGFVIVDDLKVEEIDTGVATFECIIAFDDENRLKLEELTEAGNFLLRSSDGENEFYTIIETEIDTKNHEIRVYAEDAGLDLLNEVVPAYSATETHTVDWYIEKYTVDCGFEIGINEIPETTTRKLSWDGEATATERLASVATQFGGFEISYSFEIKGMEVVKKYINIYEQRGKDIQEPLRLNKEIDKIIIKKSVANLATALSCTGGTPENKDKPITLSGYSYDDGDFYVEGKYLKSRNAIAKWSRYLWEEGNAGLGHITRQYSYDTTSQATLCSHAVTELKKICDTEVNYEIEIKKLPENIKIGDRVNVIDEKGELFLSTRILILETSVTKQEQKAILGEFLIKKSGISEKVEQLATQFSETVKTATQAQITASGVQEIAETAKTAAETAQQAAQTAQSEANTAKTAAEIAQAKAEEAESSLTDIENRVSTNEQVITETKETAQTAQTKATEAETVAQTAQIKAEEAQSEIESNVTELYGTIASQTEETVTTCETIITSALNNYVETGNYDEFKNAVNDELGSLTDRVSVTFETMSGQYETLTKEMQENFDTITTYFAFESNGLIIGKTDSPYKIVQSNNRYSMQVNDVEVLWIDATTKSAHIPVLTVSEKFMLFGYSITMDESGNVNCVYIGG